MEQEHVAAGKSQKIARPNLNNNNNNNKAKNWNFFKETLKLVGIMVHM